MAGDKPTSRRDFLRGKSAGRALLHAANALIDRTAAAVEPFTPGPANGMRGDGSAAEAMLSTSRLAMACEFAVQHYAADGPLASEAALLALNLVQELENQLSIFREHTEVSAINRTAAAGPVSVEPRLFDLIVLCRRLHDETGRTFDITSGPLSRAWGFLRREGRLPSEEEVTAALELVGFDHLELDEDQRTIRFRRPGVEINFNSVGKGYALDRVAVLMAERGVGDFLCHGGRSSVLARGSQRESRQRGWGVAIPHPLEPGEEVGQIVLRDEALGTSGAGTHFFVHEGRRFGHLIDPRTGWPSEGVFTATAVAPTAAEADALATAFYILGPGGTAEYCAAHREVGAVLVCHADGAGRFDVHAFNLSDDQWLPAASGGG
jgi:thiamine biosynthesis lipoprotein